LLAVTLAPNSFAKDSWEHDPVYLQKDAIDTSTLISPPPAKGSAEDKADVKKLLDYQTHRTKQECERASTEVFVNLESFYGPKYGPLTEGQVKKWNDLFKNIRIDTDYFVQKIKVLWKRPRPYQAHAELTPCIRLEKTASYPSGHSAISEVFSRVLQLLDPQEKQAIILRQHQIADDRVLGGVHHPTDIEAGKKIGDVIFEKLEKNPKFQSELKSLQVN
jgi:acid phosphatase (class A)